MSSTREIRAVEFLRMVREVLKASVTLIPNEALRKPEFLFDPTTLEQWNVPQRWIWLSTAREFSGRPNAETQRDL